jgi:hypothetical protein
VYPHSTEHTALQPSLAAVLPSSHASEELLIPFPQACVQLDLPHAKGGHDHPASTELQSALHPSPLMVLPSSHVSMPASLESPQVVLQTCLEIAVPPEQVYPHSTVHPAEQPSPAAVLPSSQNLVLTFSTPSVWPSPQNSLPVCQRHWYGEHLPLMLLQV